MLISTNLKFIFVANTKAASTSIEKSLIEYANIYRHTTELGKHMTMRQILSQYDFLFSLEEYNQSKFFKFGVIRDPVDWMISWFNFRSRDELANPNHPSHKNYVGSLDFNQFWQSFIDRPTHLNKGQSFYFCDSNDQIIVDYLVDFNQLEIQLRQICSFLSIPDLNLTLENKSKKIRFSRNLCDEKTQKLIYEYFSVDLKNVNYFKGKNIDFMKNRISIN